MLSTNMSNNLPIEYLDSIFLHSSIGIIICNKEGLITQINPYASKIFGYNQDELIGSEIEELVPDKFQKKHIELRKVFFQNPEPRPMGFGRKLTAKKKNGDSFFVEISLSSCQINGSEYVLGFVSDISQRVVLAEELEIQKAHLEEQVRERTKELEKAIHEINELNQSLIEEVNIRKETEQIVRSTLEKEKKLNELKTKFVSIASHEFRTPLTGILTSASLINRYNKEDDQPKRKRHVQIIKKSVKNLTVILNDFLSLDKLEQGNINDRPSYFKINDFINEIILDFKDLLKDNQVISYAEGVDTTSFQNKDILRNMMINLLSNASKYSHEGSSIYIKVGYSGNQIIISIQDEGIGIPKEEQSHLFERFFRASNVEGIQGTGLGLNIVQKYVETLDGKISFKSIEGRGSEFIVSFPLEIKS